MGILGLAARGSLSSIHSSSNNTAGAHCAARLQRAHLSDSSAGAESGLRLRANAGGGLTARPWRLPNGPGSQDFTFPATPPSRAIFKIRPLSASSFRTTPASLSSGTPARCCSPSSVRNRLQSARSTGLRANVGLLDFVTDESLLSDGQGPFHIKARIGEADH